MLKIRLKRSLRGASLGMRFLFRPMVPGLQRGAASAAFDETRLTASNDSSGRTSGVSEEKQTSYDSYELLNHNSFLLPMDWVWDSMDHPQTAW